MPYSRLQYNWDNQYTMKDKRNLLLTQEVIEKINNIMPGSPMRAQFVTQAEYDALPSSKYTDWNLYIIVDNHNEEPVLWLVNTIQENVDNGVNVLVGSYWSNENLIEIRVLTDTETWEFYVETSTLWALWDHWQYIRGYLFWWLDPEIVMAMTGYEVFPDNIFLLLEAVAANPTENNADEVIAAINTWLWEK